MTTTTTTKHIVQNLDLKKIDMFTYLDTATLTRAERSYYEKHYASYKGLEKTSIEWLEIIKFIHF